MAVNQYVFRKDEAEAWKAELVQLNSELDTVLKEIADFDGKLGNEDDDIITPMKGMAQELLGNFNNLLVSVTNVIDATTSLIKTFDNLVSKAGDIIQEGIKTILS